MKSGDNKQKIVNVNSIFLLNIVYGSLLILFLCFLLYDNYLKDVLFVSKQIESSPPEIKISSINIDINEDGEPDKIEIYKDFIQCSVNENSLKVDLEYEILFGVNLIPFKLSKDKSAVAVVSDITESGSLKHLYILTLNNNKLEFLDLPKMKLKDGEGLIGYGTDFSVSSDYQVSIFDNVIQFKNTVPLQSLYGEYDSFYGQDGNLLPECFGKINPISDVAVITSGDKELIKLTQWLYSEGYVGSLETMLTWDENLNLKIVNQEIYQY